MHSLSSRLAAVSALLLGLAACQPETIDPNKDARDAANAAAAAAPPVKPLPMIGASKIYRCDDNRIVHIDFMTDGVTANLKEAGSPVPKQMIAPEKGKSFVAEGGYSLDGNGGTVKLATPDHKSQSCKA